MLPSHLKHGWCYNIRERRKGFSFIYISKGGNVFLYCLYSLFLIMITQEETCFIFLFPSYYQNHFKSTINKSATFWNGYLFIFLSALEKQLEENKKLISFNSSGIRISWLFKNIKWFRISLSILFNDADLLYFNVVFFLASIQTFLSFFPDHIR